MTATRQRYVLLWHELPPGHDRDSHWDLLLDWDGESPLLTWALPTLPKPGQTIMARALPPHRRRYLDFQGLVSQGRGEVTRWDSGWYHLVAGDLAELVQRQTSGELVPTEHESKRVSSDRDCLRWELQLDGERLRGKLEFHPCDSESQFWNVSFEGSIAVR